MKTAENKLLSLCHLNLAISQELHSKFQLNILIDEIIFLVLSYGWLLLLLSNAYFYVEWQHSDCSTRERERRFSAPPVLSHRRSSHVDGSPFFPPTNRITFYAPMVVQCILLCKPVKRIFPPKKRLSQ